MSDLDHQNKICKGFCDAVKAKTPGELQSKAKEKGIVLEQRWRAPTDAQGSIVAAGRYQNGAENVLVVAFRSTQGIDEWMEYVTELANGTRFTTHSGKSAKSHQVFTVMAKTLNQVRLMRFAYGCIRCIVGSRVVL